jgi:hypothetical protein
LTHFLHFPGRQFGHAARRFLALFSVKQGERYFTYALHRVTGGCIAVASGILKAVLDSTLCLRPAARTTGEICSYFFPRGCSLVSRGGRLKALVRIRAGENLLLCFPVFEASLVVGVSAISKSLNRFLWGETREGNKLSQVKKARITHFNFSFCTFFSPSWAYGIDSQRLATTVPAKVTAQNGANWAGATPLFCGRSAQKFRGVAPAHMFAGSEPFGEGGQPCC